MEASGTSPARMVVQLGFVGAAWFRWRSLVSLAQLGFAHWFRWRNLVSLEGRLAQDEEGGESFQGQLWG